VLVLSALARRRDDPRHHHRGALWFAAVGLCNGLSVLAMYAALEYGAVAVISPLVAGYPLVTLLLSGARRLSPGAPVLRRSADWLMPDC
jgi:drug/metabolite transporter (DMT)-like permease